ncbi:hypothetical protein AB0O07_34120 [Streptomyces sp. NPDC093085]|uniref:hypothetical protein n=1 Tax=Streptomyces sp. NPDC093085 TaxID=3155068 RepID=UPI00342B8434
MGSLRNPVGPLPSTIYWRRRAVAATLVALLALLVVWAVTSGGDVVKKADGKGDGATPAPTITPGPSGSGPAISAQPGGRDESGGSDGGGDGGGTDAGGDGGKNGDTSGADTEGAGSGSGGGAGGDEASGGADNGGAGGAGGAGSTTSGRQVPAGSALPTCAPGSLTLGLATTKVAYGPGEKPVFRLFAKNTSDTTCKADFGPKAMVLTVTDSDDEPVWSSEDCPQAGSAVFQVPAHSTVTRTVEWDRKRSKSQCATPPSEAVGPGTYLVEAAAPGATVKQARQSIRLEKD